MNNRSFASRALPFGGVFFLTVRVPTERGNMDYINRIFNTDCISGMSMYPDKSIDMILCDLPYGITGCRWDSVLPLDQIWAQYNRIIKDNGAIVLTASQPFTTELIGSNHKMFRYCWYWVKNQVTGFPFAKKQPLRCVEDIVVFYKQAPTYNPQGLIELDNPVHTKGRADKYSEFVYDRQTLSKAYDTKFTGYPRQTLYFKCQREGLHPTQKPVDLFEYLIRTYTNPGENVLDTCMGSGTTAVACINTGRNFTGFEIVTEYYDTAIQRINAALSPS